MSKTIETPGCYTCPFYRSGSAWAECTGTVVKSKHLPVRGHQDDDTPPEDCPLRRGGVKVRGVGAAFREQGADE